MQLNQSGMDNGREMIELNDSILFAGLRSERQPLQF